MADLTTPAAQITPTGIVAPSFDDVLAWYQQQYRSIFGSDIYIAEDSQDGQWIAIQARAMHDANQMAVAVYNAFSPKFAQGTNLSSVVAINGIRRKAGTFSTAVGSVGGTVGTVINNGVVEDENGNLWNLPTTVTIPGAGSIQVTVTAQDAGAIAAPSGTINKIATPTFGWATFASTSDAAPGSPTESDADLRRRQAASTALSAKTPLGSIYGNVANLSGVTRAAAYENFTGAVDANGLPPHSISLIVEGGDVQDIVDAIGTSKTPGANTYGTTSGTFIDELTGLSYTINYFALATVSIDVNIIGTAMAGWNSAIVAEIKASIAAYLNSLAIGQDVQYSRLWSPAYLNGAVDGETYEITTLQIRIHSGGGFGVADIVVPFNKAAFCDQANITVAIS